MKRLMLFMAMSMVLVQAGCDDAGKEVANKPADALNMIEDGNERRDIIIVHGSYKVHEKLFLYVFRGVMNDKDIWLADIRKENLEMGSERNNPFERQGSIQTVTANREHGYEAGYIESDVPVPDGLYDIGIEEIEVWKIWIKPTERN